MIIFYLLFAPIQHLFEVSIFNFGGLKLKFHTRIPINSFEYIYIANLYIGFYFTLELSWRINSKLALCLTNNIQSNFLFSRTIFVLQFHFLVPSFSTKWLPKCFSFTRIQFLVDRVINCFTQKISYSTLTSLIIKGFLNVFVLILRTKIYKETN